MGIWCRRIAVEARRDLDEWREDLRVIARSRVKARLKFMIDDIGPEGMRERSNGVSPHVRRSRCRRPAPGNTGVHERLHRCAGAPRLRSVATS
jgi:hypothetical protein